MLAIQILLHPTDFSDRSEYALRLHVRWPATMMPRSSSFTSRHFRRSLAAKVCCHRARTRFAPKQTIVYGASRSRTWVSASSRLELGDPATVILHVAKEIGADVIVMGTHGRTGLGRLLMGSVAEQVVRRSECPVLTISHPPARSTTPTEVFAGAGDIVI